MNENLLVYLIAYIIGSVPFGLLIGKFFAKVDVRASGSGSIGATNVLRVLKEKDPKKAKQLAILTVVCDALKGALPIIIAKFIGFGPNVLWTMAVLAVLGHCFSPFLKFEGGKGIATGLGVLAVFLPLEAVIALVGWFVAGKVLKISSIASLIGLLVFVIASFIAHPNIEGINTHAPILIIALIVIYKHIPNIKRLFEGKETKVV